MKSEMTIGICKIYFKKSLLMEKGGRKLEIKKASYSVKNLIYQTKKNK